MNTKPKPKSTAKPKAKRRKAAQPPPPVPANFGKIQRRVTVREWVQHSRHKWAPSFGSYMEPKGGLRTIPEWDALFQEHLSREIAD